ncbi:hypothetical protein ACFS5N_00105 [Mucilaginibacter ximonensis]|uniref:Uncharacterized protein n=1 Tax=Mucilaginibacter ximonensis TaxID=538021 RepID=A0ABW5Y723_9SPHI
MKIYLILAFCAIFISCSKKTHTADSTHATSKIQEFKDSVNDSNLLTIDKSVTTTNMDLDTAIVITGHSLLGNFNLQDSSGHFENNDLTIDFTTDKLGLNIAFKASPKSKVINAHYHQKSVIQNNVLKTDKSKLSTVRKTDIQRDSTYKHIADQSDPSVISNLKSTIGWIIILLMIGTIVFFLVKKQLLKL